jgi:hypothetical protein
MSPTRSLSLHGLAWAIALWPLAGSALAKEYNQPKRLPSSAQAKVNSVLAGVARVDPNNAAALNTTAGCDSNVGVGNVQLRPGQQAPREVITVVTGDVINVNKGCR